jgi:exodeoxyribonuclease VII small subunit
MTDIADDEVDPHPDIPALPFEKALAELEDIVKQLEGGRVPLEDSIAIYERGEALKRHCDSLLKRAEARIERVTLGPGGRPTGTAPLDPPSGAT